LTRSSILLIVQNTPNDVAATVRRGVIITDVRNNTSTRTSDLGHIHAAVDV
jgi:predicted secreted protein